MEMHSRPSIFSACPFGYTSKHEASAIKQLKYRLENTMKIYVTITSLLLSKVT